MAADAKQARRPFALLPLLSIYTVSNCIHDKVAHRSTRGVIQIVSINDFPLPVRDGIIEQSAGAWKAAVREP